MTGYDLLKEMRADPYLAKVPFIMITAASKTENVIAAKQAGVNNYIVKPFNAQTLCIQDRSGLRRRDCRRPRDNPYHFSRRATRAACHPQPPAHARPHRDRIVAATELGGVDAGGGEHAIDAIGGRPTKSVRTESPIAKTRLRIDQLAPRVLRSFSARS